jgi:hypothetical protein
MLRSDKGLTRQELRTALRGGGIRVSEVQLEQWHKKGLLSRPRGSSLGRGRGMESRYPFRPPEAAMVAGMRRKVRRLDLIGWYLWCFGFPGHASQAKALLRRLILHRREVGSGIG